MQFERDTTSMGACK